MHRLVMLSLAAACATSRGAERVAGDVEQRTGHRIDLERRADDPPRIPPGVRLDDGLTQDEAVALAIWNSPRLRVDLTRLAFAQGDLMDARRPTNPTLRFLFPAGPQQLSALLTWPLENLLFMRRRVALARANLDAVAQSTVQLALDLTRDVRLAHVEWQLASDRVTVRRAIATQADGIAAIANARATAGDAPLTEGDAASADARVAADEARRAEADVAIAATRLRAVIGWSSSEVVLRPQPTDMPAENVASAPGLEASALESRPDLRAAELAMDAARARLRVERASIVKIAGVGNLQGRSVTGGVQAELPLFNQNQGAIARARADMDSAAWRFRGLRDQIVADVTVARAQLERAFASLGEYRDTIMALRQRDVQAVTAAYDGGETDYSAVFLAAQRLEIARLREVELVAEVRRSATELERALGRRLAAGRGGE